MDAEVLKKKLFRFFLIEKVLNVITIINIMSKTTKKWYLKLLLKIQKNIYV